MSQCQFCRKPHFLLALALVAGLGIGAARWQTGAVGQETSNAISPKATHQAAELSKAFRDAAEMAMPSVVTVRSKINAHPVRGSSRGHAGRENPLKGQNPFKGTPFEDFFNDNNNLGFDVVPPGHREGMGSGVIIDKSGIILTNNHVVEGADEVVVHLADGREFKADDIKTDEKTDLAVIRISGAGTLPAAKLGDSEKMEIGDWVLAIGNPFELDHTVSAGIISGKGRELRSIQRAQFLQTDAAINPGNSGGPLVNLEGEVVGINTAIATNNGSYQGVGFAIPINLAKWVTTQLIQKGSVQRAYLGVQIGEMNKELAAKFEVKPGEGVLVNEVFPNTPASDAGLRVGDIVTEFNGHKVHTPRELQDLVERAPLNSKQKLGVLRDGKTENLAITAQAMPKQFGSTTKPLEASHGDEAETSESNKLGLDVTDLKSEQADQLGYKDVSGVLVTSVDPNGPAAEQGLRPGMLIMKVGKKNVKNVEEFDKAIKKESLKEGVLLLVHTQGGNRFVVLQEE